MDLIYLEDDPIQSAALIEALSSSNVNVIHFDRMNDLLADLPMVKFDMMILDWMLPDGNADKVIKSVRNSIGWSVPIIITSIRGEEENIVSALQEGADDYLIKPIRTAELLARVDAHNRRSTFETPPQSIIKGQYELLPQQQTLLLRGMPVMLSVLEFTLVNFLFQNAGKLVSRPTLLRYVWKIPTDVETRTVDATIARLRKKCNFSPETGLNLQTVHGFGYRLSDIVEAN